VTGSGPSRRATAGAGRAARTRRLAAAALVALALAPGVPRAADPLPLRLSARDGRVLAALDLGRAFGAADDRELGNGLTNVVAIWVAVLPVDGGPPALVYGRIIDILFDVWEERYVVTVKDPRAPQGLRLVLRDARALHAFLAEERDLDLGPVSLLPEGSFVVEARVEVNPISKEQLLRTREFIANPAAGSRPGGGSRSVLGAMASFLLREPAAGADVHVFRSRALQRGEVVTR
jgi:hypothetical protein